MHAPHERVVIATGNAGKLRELRKLLADLPFELVAQGDLGIESAEETGTSFLQNALLKARHAASLSGLAAMADDSGLEVDALDGAPGIHSARYAGAAADDAANNAKLIAALRSMPHASRRAVYRCVLVFVADADADPVIAEGLWEGCIAEAPRGRGGFGYDPYFWLPQLGKTAAELLPADKNRVSHRGIALRSLRTHLVADRAFRQTPT
ncbi:MAG: RdgB/HAM1 family non-canonical purine NTP pyrophosphatase [Pseudomonadota bacterium]|nr:RdgB/HAM1 family non-canonical purine NTP pyrophosphatase [Pseudomonadota bacterium]